MVRNQVRVVGLVDERVMSAMLSIPRHEFVSKKYREVAYSDAELPISDERLIARPEMLAKLLDASNIRKDDIVLEVGCGTGYASHIIASIAAKVVAVDNCKKSINKATKIARELEVQNIECFYQDDLTNIDIDLSGITLAIINGAVFTRDAEDMSHIQDKNDLFNIRTGHVRDNLLKIPKVICVEGYYNFSPMNIVEYFKGKRNKLDQIYIPELRV
jgi:protein-L-isoaspartate(D-aspartate) O-methyltransferase